MISRLVSSPAIDLLERTLSFTERRHELLVSNIANVDTPGYVQQEVSVKDFQAAMQKAIEARRAAYNAPLEPENTDTVEFTGAAVRLKPQKAADIQPFHDRGARSVETLMSQLADNAQAHNIAAQLLRSRFDTIRQAIQMRV